MASAHQTTRYGQRRAWTMYWRRETLTKRDPSETGSAAGATTGTPHRLKKARGTSRWRCLINDDGTTQETTGVR